MKQRLFSMVVLLTPLLVFPVTAHAYLDPGTGSALLQGIIGAIAALGVVLKLYWHRVLRLLGLRKKTPVDLKKEESANDK